MKCTVDKWIQWNFLLDTRKLFSRTEAWLFCLLEKPTNTNLIHSRNTLETSTTWIPTIVTTHHFSSPFFVLHDCFTKQDRNFHSLNKKIFIRNWKQFKSVLATSKWCRIKWIKAGFKWICSSLQYRAQNEERKSGKCNCIKILFCIHF